jgi:hypothetical protein
MASDITPPQIGLDHENRTLAPLKKNEIEACTSAAT